MTTKLSLDEEIAQYPQSSAVASSEPALQPLYANLALSRRWLTWAIPLAIFLLALVPRVLGLDAFLTADEDDQLRFAAGFLTAVLSRNWHKAVLLGYPGVPTMALAGLGLGVRYLFHQWGLAPLPAAGPDLASTLASVTQYPLAYIQAARLPLVVVASLAVLGMYAMLRRLLGRRIALLAALLIAFDPFFTANSRILHVDTPLAYFMFLSFLAFFLYLKEGGWHWLVVSGLTGALATLSKTPGALLGPILFATGMIYALHPTPDAPARPGEHGAASLRWRRFIIALAIWGLVAAIAFYALWPTMWVRPGRALNLLVQNIRIAAQTNHPTSGVFWGVTGADRSPAYYLISLPLRLSPLTSLGLIAGLVATWRLRRLRVLLLALWSYAILFMLPVSIVGRRGDRYILPVYLVLDVLAAIALYWVANRLASRPWTRLKVRWRWVLGGLVLAQAVFVSLYYPYYFQFFNPLVGGGLTAPRLINVGWGEGLDQAAAYLNRLPDASQKTVAAWYSYQFAPFFAGRTADLSNNEAALTSDYSVFYINQVQRGFPSQELLAYFQQRQPVHVVRLAGVDYAWIYAGPVISTQPPAGVRYGVGAVLGGAVRLIGFDLPGESFAADEKLPITLYWEPLAPIREDYNAYVRLIDAAGNVWGMVDRLPLGGLWRTSAWQPGTFIRDDYVLSLRPGAPPGVYHLEVALYSFTSGETFGVARNVGQVVITPARHMPRPKDMAMQHTVRTSLVPGLELMGYDLSAEKVGPGQRLAVTLYWRSTRPLDTDYAVNFEAKSVAGNEGGGWLNRLSSEAYPTSQWRWGEVIVDMHQLQMPPTARSGLYLLTMRLADAATHNLVSNRVILGKLEFVERVRNFETPQVQHSVGISLGGVVQLIGYDLPQTSVAAGESFPLTLYWRALDEMDTSYTVFVHVVGPDGVIRGQWDSVPGSGSLPTTGWVKDEVITDRYSVPMHADAPPWLYVIEVGMYDSVTGERLRLAGSQDRDTIVLGLLQGQ